MFALDIPGYGALRIEHLVLDYNGTLAVDGRLLPGVKSRLQRLARRLRIHVVTADTFGTARRALRGSACRLTVLAAAGQSEAKALYVRRIGQAHVACIGNGRNDRRMLRAAALGIVVLQAEGAAGEAVAAADIVMTSINHALELFMHPQRLVASLRS